MSKRENFYRRDPSKALSGMIGLTLEERGVYNTVLDLLYSTWRPIEDDRLFIANWCGCAVQKLNPILNRLIETGRLITFVEGSRTYVSDEAFEAERTAVKGTAPTRSGRAKVEEKSGQVGEKSAGVEQNLPLLDTDNAGNQSVTALEKNRQEKKPPNPQGGTVTQSDFDRFWSAYPAKVGKKAAARAWSKAKDRPPLPDVLAALDRYRRTKPADRDWCNPSTWLNEGRWDDGEPGGSAAPGQGEAPSTFNAPQVRASIVHATDEDFARSYVDHYCRWVPEGRLLEARTPAVAAMLTQKLAAWAKAKEVTITVAAANDSPAPAQRGAAA